jgi:hypothetical protein
MHPARRSAGQFGGSVAVVFNRIRRAVDQPVMDLALLKETQEPIRGDDVETRPQSLRGEISPSAAGRRYADRLQAGMHQELSAPRGLKCRDNPG